MEIIPGERYNIKGSLYLVKSIVRFSIFNAFDGRQIAEILVEGIEKSVKNPDEVMWQNLLKSAKIFFTCLVQAFLVRSGFKIDKNFSKKNAIKFVLHQYIWGFPIIKKISDFLCLKISATFLWGAAKKNFQRQGCHSQNS